MRLKNLLLSGLLIFCCFLSLNAQSMDSKLEELSAVASSAYLGPAVHTFGASMNAGWLNKPPSEKILGFDIEFGLVAMASYFKDGAQTFSTDGNFRFSTDQAQTLTKSISDAAIRSQVVSQITSTDYQVLIAGPTVNGYKNNHVYVTFSPKGATTFKVKDAKYPFSVDVALPTQTIDLGATGYMDGLKIMPSAAPQLKIGTIYGTQAIIRALPATQIKDAGKLKLFGFGLQHNPALWMKTKLPVDLSIGFLTQTMSITNVVDFKTFAFGANVSKTFGLSWVSVTPYAGLIIEHSKMDVDYTSTINTDAGEQVTHIAFSMTGENKSKVNLGAYVHLLHINFVADYNIGKYSSFSVGTFFNF